MIKCEHCDREYELERKFARHKQRSAICGPKSRGESTHEKCGFSDLVKDLLEKIEQQHQKEIAELIKKYEGKTE